jgi:hypothetical protein
MKLLQQELYKDENGRDIEADKVDCLAPIQYGADGFYNWECMCGNVHFSRAGWQIAGQVLKCDKCGKMNLLVRTDCDLIYAALSGKWQSEERDKENQRLKGIQKFNEQQMRDIRQLVFTTVRDALNKALGDNL